MIDQWQMGFSAKVYLPENIDEKAAARENISINKRTILAPTMLKLSLTSISGFQFVAEADAVLLSSIAKVLTRNQGDSILLSGESVNAMYLVAEGTVGVYRSGISKPIVELGPGQCFGEMAFIESTRASATIRAMVNGTTLVMLRQQDLKDLCDGNPVLNAALLKGIAVTLSQRLRTTTSKIANELATGKKLLEELGAIQTFESVDLHALPTQIIQQHEDISKGLDGVLECLESLTKIPERSLVVNNAISDLNLTKEQCEKFFLTMSKHVTAISRFLSSMEEFVNKGVQS